MKFHEVTDIFPMMSTEESAALKADIASNGLHEAIWTWQGKIIDGRNRYNACVELGIEPRYREWDGQGNLTAFIISMNLHRRHLDESQRAMVAAKLANMPHGGDRKSDQTINLLFDQVSQADAAQMMQVSIPSITHAKKVLTEGTPELAQVVEQGKVTVSLAAMAVKELPKRKQTEMVTLVEQGVKPKNAYRKVKQANAETKELPTGKYRIIYADPPWKYSDSGHDDYGPAERHYSAMSIEELCALPISKLAEDNAVLFLWATSPMLEDAFRIINAWGFKYKTSFIWDKVKHNFGHYNSVRHEFLLICTRGSCTPDSDKKFDSVQSIERSAKHSEKPEKFRAIIDKLYTHGGRIELFARSRVEGWEVWGNEIG